MMYNSPNYDKSNSKTTLAQSRTNYRILWTSYKNKVISKHTNPQHMLPGMKDSMLISKY